MTKISLTNMGVTFIMLTFIFTSFSFMYSSAGDNGYNVDDLNESIFNDIGDQEKFKVYVNESSNQIRDVNTDKNLFDVIGGLISIALAPVRTIIGGADFLITNTGKLLGYIGIPTIVSNFITGLITFIVSTLLLFPIILGRRDKND